jgi:hypothetical protein
MVRSILNEAAEIMEVGAEIYRRKESVLRPMGGPQLEIMADVMRDFVAERRAEKELQKKGVGGKEKQSYGGRAENTQDVDLSHMFMLERLEFRR